MIWEFGSNLSAVSRSVSPSHAAGRRKCNSGTTWKQKYGRQHREGQTILQSVQDVVPWKMHRRRNLAKLDQNTVQSQKRNRHESAKRHTTEAENNSKNKQTQERKRRKRLSRNKKTADAQKVAEDATRNILLCILTPTLVRGINSRRVIYYPRTTYSLRINRVIILALTVDSTCLNDSP